MKIDQDQVNKDFAKAYPFFTKAMGFIYILMWIIIPGSLIATFVARDWRMLLFGVAYYAFYKIIQYRFNLVYEDFVLKDTIKKSK